MESRDRNRGLGSGYYCRRQNLYTDALAIFSHPSLTLDLVTRRDPAHNEWCITPIHQHQPSQTTVHVSAIRSVGYCRNHDEDIETVVESYGVVPIWLFTFLGSLQKKAAKTTSGTLVYRFQRQTTRQRKKKSFEKHCVLDLGFLSQEPSDSCILYFNVIFHGK